MYGDYEPTELTLIIKGCDGKDVTKNITQKQLQSMAVDGKIVYQFWPPAETMGGGYRVVVGTRYVTIDKLLSEYGVEALGNGDTLMIGASDNSTLNIKKSDLDTCQYYFPDNGDPEPVPAALLLS